MPAAVFPFAFAALLLLAACRGVDVARPPSSPHAPAAPSVAPRDAFVVLSGGGTPTSNNYSQYIQARAFAAFLRERYSPEAVWTFFGQGNREGEKPVLADVYRQIKDDGLLLDTWLPGALPDNRPATKENVLRTLRAEILPRVRGGGTLYFFVGDHGELTSGKNPESAITLWGLKRDPARPNGWSTARDYALTVSELRDALVAGLGAGRVVFVMTQCHSGGFHELGVPREMQPPATWFLSPPAWLGAAPKSLPAVAGFTATDEASIAAGCVPDPDPETWAGYERFFPEQLLGRDLLGGRNAVRPASLPAASLHDAHAAAVLVDHTLDKPRSSSEHFLERWASLIETRLAHELLLTPRVRSALEAYRAAIDTGEIGNTAATDPALRETQARFAQFTARLIEQNPSARTLITRGTAKKLEAAFDPDAPRPRERDLDDNDDAVPDLRLSRTQLRAWREVLRPAWTKAVAAGAATTLPAAAVAFEKRLQAAETRGRPAGFSDAWSNRALNELYWSSTYAVPEKFHAATAAAVTRWAATRRVAILEWAANSPAAAVREAAAKFDAGFRQARTPPPRGNSTKIPRSTAAERTLFYRRVLAAWAFLLAVDHQPALTQLHALRALEHTPLPAP